ncbi:MAG: hypothetical protein IJ756_07440 [Paludibacteraceae bacterium]|nr:hypothetical protein [Paludibacteraceae bacterium]
MPSFAFRIHEPKQPGATAPTSASTMEGWTPTSYIAGPLLSNIQIDNPKGRMGTSIPSVFARIFLFDIAFQSFNGKNISEILNPPQNLKMEAILISECLDMLEFLFQHGADPKLVVKHWNGTQQITALKNSALQEHHRLADVLQDEIANYPDFSDIYLFYWKDSTANSLTPQEFLIGGTSPMTLAFTAPNWKETMRQNGFSFTRTGDGSPLFDSNQIQALPLRDANFQNMLYSMRMAFHGQFNRKATNFEQYIATCYNNAPQNSAVADMGANPTSFYATFKPVKDINGAAISTASLPLCYQPIKVVSGYEIVPTADRYSTYTANNGSIQNIPAPLMLDKNGIPNVNYIGNRQWNAGTCIINEAVVRGSELHTRQLPGGMGVVYPFLIWSDLLEDKIVKVPYTIDGNRFITATNGEAHYLLPLRRTFFKFFNIEDVDRILKINISGNSVDVTLHIPLNNPIHPYIDILHTYQAQDIVEVPLTLGVFPFYKTGTDDSYRILQCGNHSANASFYDVEGRIIPGNYTIRTPDIGSYETRYYDVRQAFDLIEVKDINATALNIPKLQPINVGRTQFTFAVDFGTSNTYIAYSTPGNSAETLEFGDTDQQAVYMHRHDSISNGMLQNMSSNHFLREFAPERIGGNELFRFPTTTAACELTSTNGVLPSLFGTISMGFKMMNEKSFDPNARYITQLKWLLEKRMDDAHNNALIKNYFTQILWMLKNKAVQNGGDTNFTVRLTFPETMPIPLKNALVGLWNNAKTDLKLPCTIDSSFSESLAPYNVTVKEFGTSSFLNIDIGGGTHDILFVNRNETGNLISANYSSARFAGDDLWGDGTVITNQPTLNNGFVDYLYKKIDSERSQYRTDIISPLDTLKGGMANTSGDIMSYLFRYDNIFQTATSIRANQNAYSIVFIHYMALMYHIARLIKKQQVGIPNYISFTGMGSKYINLISPDSDDILQFTKLLLEKYTGQKVPALFKIKNNRSDAKEITAKGALTIPDTGYLIPKTQLNSIVDYGFDTQEQIIYRDMRTGQVQQKVINEYLKFLKSLSEKDIAQFIHQHYGLTIPNVIIATLTTHAQNSYNTIAGGITTAFDDFNLSETLFFYPLKNALIECSKTIQ